ncbi:TRAP-type C4-dicarboxylate transport system permease small subunit [Limimaricola soesokkakensis]|uniref:TRAP transporter small permease protein n=1 Tax=Limimaricola soesokkakensis TaxID=1343159 RepID=A0A1X7A0W1_9RHOB|nr:TRAP transporter small permease [Limimaricola soesokkakensis]PSK81546.1 TRAP-type C4-dicarboxylate transport system permease small subunit [Limimaricola soesokkakensis]SLN67093.1 2,3-diketo-L-gulonate TRAP transporter small permease protein YiaM [Limimaricola soesokkakensis]
MLEKTDRMLTALNRWSLIGLLTAMVCIIFANVALRYLTNHSIIWAEEVARYLMVWMTFLGAGLALRRGGHVAITALPDALGPRAAMVLRGVVALLLLGFAALMVKIGVDYMGRMGRQLTPATRISFWWIYLAMPMGFALFAAHLALALVSYLRSGSFEPAERSAAPRGLA